MLGNISDQTKNAALSKKKFKTSFRGILTLSNVMSIGRITEHLTNIATRS